MNQPPYQQPAWGPSPQPSWGAPPPPQPPKKPNPIAMAGLAVGILIVVIGTVVATEGSSTDDAKSDSAATTSAKPKAADHSKLDDAASLACDDFAHGYKAAQTQQARIDLANKVNKWAQQSETDGIADNAIALARGSEASASAWQLGADAFAKSCLDAGWKG